MFPTFLLISLAILSTSAQFYYPGGNFQQFLPFGDLGQQFGQITPVIAQAFPQIQNYLQPFIRPPTGPPPPSFGNDIFGQIPQFINAFIGGGRPNPNPPTTAPQLQATTQASPVDNVDLNVNTPVETETGEETRSSFQILPYYPEGQVEGFPMLVNPYESLFNVQQQPHNGIVIVTPGPNGQYQ